MTPSEIRNKVLREHAALRVLMTEANDACRKVREDRASLADLVYQVDRLVRSLAKHLEMEDRVLVPTLREIDAWGAVRAENIAAEHERQRAELIELATLGHDADNARLLAATLSSFVQALVFDMEGEERDLLHPDLLRDDAVVIDQTDG
jgi:iron-sulfur cluster repair protein YtfE (RIC family)